MRQLFTGHAGPDGGTSTWLRVVMVPPLIAVITADSVAKVDWMNADTAARISSTSPALSDTGVPFFCTHGVVADGFDCATATAVERSARLAVSVEASIV